VVRFAGMLALDAELRRIVEALDRARVAYALAGGLAVSVYTVARATEEIEIFIARLSRERALAVLAALGYQRAGRSSPAAGGRLEIDRLITVDGTDVLPVDLISAIDAALMELCSDRVRVKWGEGEICLAGPASLRALCHLRGNTDERAELETLIGAAVEIPDAEATLRAVSGLRELFGALPHLPTDAEMQHLRRFECLTESPASADRNDVEVLLAGWRRWWRNGMIRDLVAMAGRLPADVIECDRRLQSYLEAARVAQTGERR
jgi:hypothetical protein